MRCRILCYESLQELESLVGPQFWSWMELIDMTRPRYDLHRFYCKLKKIYIQGSNFRYTEIPLTCIVILLAYSFFKLIRVFCLWFCQVFNLRYPLCTTNEFLLPPMGFDHTIFGTWKKLCYFTNKSPTKVLFTVRYTKRQITALTFFCH